MELLLQSLQEIDQAAKQLLDYAADRKKITFVGEIGAGKTTFIKAIAKEIGVETEVTSPTFSLINEYEYQKVEKQCAYVYHIDLYRLRTIQEAMDIGIEDYLYDQHYCFIEWPQLIEPILPDDVVQVFIEALEDSSRKVLFL